MRKFIPDITGWGLWFAWHPVTVFQRGGVVRLWLCYVMRRRCGVVYEYREVIQDA